MDWNNSTPVLAGEDYAAAMLLVRKPGTPDTAAQIPVSALTKTALNSGSALQILAANLYLQNNNGGGMNIMTDSIGHGAYVGNAYEHGWPYILARMLNATFGSKSVGFYPMEGIYNSIPSLVTKQLVDVTFTGNWGALASDPAPYNYPLGKTGSAAAEFINGKAYESTDPGATITLKFPTIAARLVLLFTKRSGGGTYNVTVNGVAAPALNTNGSLAYNEGYALNLTDDGKGECTVVLTKADSSLTDIYSIYGLLSEEDGVDQFAKRISVQTYGHKGRTLSTASQACIARISNAPCLIMAVGYNDWASLNTDTDDVAFAAFVQRIDWLIYYCKAVRNLVIVPDFIWYAGPTSRTRQQLKRLATETGGRYIPFADEFFANGALPIQSPPELNTPVAAWADIGHPHVLGNEIIATRISREIGLAVTSKHVALAYHDWPFPLKIDLSGFTNDTPSNIRTISTVQQIGGVYAFKLNIKNTASPIPTGPLYTLINNVPAKFRGGVSLGLQDHYVPIGVNSATGAVNGLAIISGDGQVRARAYDAFIDKFRGTIIVAPSA